MLVETYWIDVTFRRWALWRPCAWLWRLIGYLPRWALRIRRCDPPPDRRE